MNGFRLYSLEIDSELIRTDKIELVNISDSLNSNYFSLMIGNNGTGKSRILSEVARFFKKTEKHSDPNLSKHSYFEYNITPSKIIAVTNSISDKFPTDQSFMRFPPLSKGFYYKDFYYNYLGTRSRYFNSSKNFLINRALQIVFENYSERDISRNYRHIFDYLNYEPVIKLNYQFINPTNSGFKPINPNSMISYVKNIGIDRHLNISKYLVSTVEERAYELCDFILQRSYYGSNNNELTVNFSEKNIGRIQKNELLYTENFHEYELISILEKIGLIRTMKVQLFKKYGMSFSFDDASSGEANILSTLLSLVPLLKDNSLILIDEPEISLHPLWQAKYIDLLNKTLGNVSGCHVIIASHSPFLASDLKPHNSSVVSLKSKKGIIHSNLINKSTYGWSAEDILLNVFGMETTRNFDLYESVSEALYLLANGQKFDEKLIAIKYKLREFYPSILDTDPIKPVIKAIFEAISYD